MALARVLQEQERAYFALQFNAENTNDKNNNHEEGKDNNNTNNSKSSTRAVSPSRGGGGDEGSPLGTNTFFRGRGRRGGRGGGEEDADEPEEEETTTSEEEEEDEEEEEMDPSEALARKLMEEEERAHRERMLAYAGVSLNASGTTQGHVMVEGEDIPPEDDDVADPDDMTYEELLQLGECVGRQATGMSGSQIKQFCTLKKFTRSGATGEKMKGGDEEEEDCCSVCRCEFEEGEMTLELKCKHGFHEECLRPWLKEYKTCPLCKTECM